MNLVLSKWKFLASACLLAGLVAFMSIGAAAQTLTPGKPPDWSQWGLNPQHTLFEGGVVGQPLNQNAVILQYDFNIAAEKADPNAADGLDVHYQVPLIDGNDIFIESKDGTYSNSTYSTQKWHQNKYTWQGGTLVKVWTFNTDWFAPGSSALFWEPVYHAVLANGVLYDPGQGGTIFKINKSTGAVIKRINPFGATINPNTFTASPLTADSSGNIYYNVVQVTQNNPTGWAKDDVVNSWLVRVSPSDTITKVSYATLFSQAIIKGEAVPQAIDSCKVQFAAQPPWPPSPSSTPPNTQCGSQRAALNIAPAIAPDGTIYTIAKAHLVTRYNYLVAVNGNLTGKWAASFRGRLNDGCGVSFPIGNPGGAGANGGCGAGTAFGVDPSTNEPPPARVLDDSSSTPTIAPDGSIFYGAYTRYNWAQGHMLHFSANGDFLNSFNFGWDNTPAIYPHGGTYSVIFKNNHYGGAAFGDYCDDPTVCPDRSNPNASLLGPEQYFVSQFDPSLNIEWSFRNTNTNSCTRNPNGTITCVSDHPNGFEWCVNAAVVDANGTVYANSEDGNLYAIGQGGVLIQNIFQNLAIGAAYTPASLDNNGRIYSQNDGFLFVVTK
jgi:hypothetical protein